LPRRWEKTSIAFLKKSIKDLQDYSWPGNIRELENIVERAVITSQDGKIAFDLPQNKKILSFMDQPMEKVEREHLLNVLKKTNWKIEGLNGAAEILNLNPSTLRGRLRKLQIKKD
jgi:transcriptional regulator with GAF, ATPase, and Fis domain